MFFKSNLFFLLFIPLAIWSQPNYTILSNNNPHPDNLFFHVGGPPVKPVNIMDSDGNIIYTEDMGLKGWAWKVNENNQITYFDRQSKGWFVMDSLENITDTVYCQNGYQADNHDFLALENGNYVIFAYDEQPYATDTISPDGSSNASVIGLVIQELDPDHNVVFEWKSWDHFFMSNYPNINFNPNVIDFLHCNAIDIDEDGHFLISNRTISEITKIHRTTGEIIWRFGGSQSDFEFTNDYPFSKQHCIKSLGNNHYLLFDNGNQSDTYTGGIKRSRGVEYALDLNDFTATKTWDYVHSDSLFTPSIGSIQRLDNGNTLINFGNNQNIERGSVVIEVDANNNVVFELEMDNGQNIYCANKANWNFYTEPVVSIKPLINSTIKVYPNPSKSTFNIRGNEKMIDEIEIKIFNLSGKNVFTKLLGFDEVEYPLAIHHNLSPGNYNLQLSTSKDIFLKKLSIVD